MRGITCCHKCTDRKEGCHAVCQKYLAETAEREKLKKVVQKKKDEISDYAGFRSEMISKSRRNHR